MIDVVIGCLLGVLGGAVMSHLLHKWLTKKLTKKIHLSKGGFMRISHPAFRFLAYHNKNSFPLSWIQKFY